MQKMNAYELACQLQGVISVLNVHHEEDCLFIANECQYMLRQQADRIAELEKQVKHWTTPCQPLCKPSVCDCITPQTKLSDEEYEEIMKQWDYWREQIANGDKSSAPRDWFECILEAKLKGQ
jgi:hypothetical protein